MLKIKANAITNLTDARYFAAKEVEWLSFNFRENTPDYIEPMRARAIFEWVEGPKILGEFETLTDEEIAFYTEGWHLHAVQVRTRAQRGQISAKPKAELIKEFRIEPFTNPDFLEKEMTAWQTVADVFELNFEGVKLSWSDLKNEDLMLTQNDLMGLVQRFKILLNIDFQLVDLENINSSGFHGLILRGGDEERIGVKSFDELDEIFDALEELNVIG